MRAEAQVLADLGWPLSEEEVVARFVGRSAASMQAEIECELGHPIDWEATFGAAHAAAFDEGLEAVEGAEGAVDAVLAAGMAVCVASSSRRDAIADKLRRTGLHARFEGATFSADDVAHGKPAPDVFLLAAATLGAEPSACAVIEDSPSGVAAGLAAGMAVFAYASGLVPDEQLALEGVTLFTSMQQLPALLSRRR